MAGGRRSQHTSPPLPTFTREAYPLPSKQPGWKPLHLIFRTANLPPLPEIHQPDILTVLSHPIYEKAAHPSRYSIKTLAWMGDAALLLAATKAVLLGPFEDKTNPHLSAIRSGLTNNRTFSYLTASYRILDHFVPAHAPFGQKRYADYFEAYIGAAWISAKETGDPDQIRNLESYLSKLFKPKVWPALESLMKGSGGLMSTVRLEQDLESGSEGDVGDISVFDVPPIEGGGSAKHRGGTGKKKRKILNRHQRRAQEAQIQDRHRRHERRTGVRGGRENIINGNPHHGGSSSRPIILD